MWPAQRTIRFLYRMMRNTGCCAPHNDVHHSLILLLTCHKVLCSKGDVSKGGQGQLGCPPQHVSLPIYTPSQNKTNNCIFCNLDATCCTIDCHKYFNVVQRLQNCHGSNWSMTRPENSLTTSSIPVPSLVTVTRLASYAWTQRDK